MTFYEAALRVLEESTAPLHSTEITRRAIEKGLLAHVGKTPELTMLSRLAAMARRSRDRRLMVTARDTFALTDWMLTEDSQALQESGLPELNPEESMPPYRSSERHPEPRAEYLRAIGRQSDRKRRDDDTKRRRYPPIAEVVFELLQECRGALAPAELLARMKSREVVSDELSQTQVIEALAEDNQRRIDQGRRPVFSAVRTEDRQLQICIEPSAEGGPTPLDVQKSFCEVTGLRFEGTGVVLRQATPGARPVGETQGPTADDVALLQQAKHAVRDARRAMLKVMRRRLGELDAGTFERSCIRLLHAQHVRDLKVARRSKDGPLVTGRMKSGSLELRVAVRILKGNAHIERRHVQELRKDLGHNGANVGILLSPGEARGDARAEAIAGGAFIMMWCSDALAEKFFESEVGVSVTRLELVEIDATFFDQAAKDAEETQRRRDERHREKEAQRSEPSARSETPTGGRPAVEASPEANETSDTGSSESDDEEGSESDDGSEPVAGAAPTGEASEQGEGGRRRRRRRRRRRGAGRPDEQSAAGVAGAPQENAVGITPEGTGSAPAVEGAPPSDAPAMPEPAPPVPSEISVDSGSAP